TTISELLKIEPGLGFQTAASTGPNEISTVAAADGESIVYAVLSKNNTCFYVRDSVKDTTSTPPGGTYFGRKDSATAAGACDAASPPATMYKTADLASW
ncbi:MAG TPA: hypothetical protein VMZ51_00480, partial [Acidimicrobiales bacterium]|nr:hypothetical protein [Acidimicrobiales bacterium]